MRTVSCVTVMVAIGELGCATARPSAVRPPSPLAAPSASSAPVRAQSSTAALATLPGAAPHSPPAERAVSLVRSVHGKRRTSEYSGFGERFRRAVPEATFIGLLDDLERKLGKLLEVRVLDQSGSAPLTTVHLAAFFERGTRRYEVTLDAGGVVQGLFVRSFIDESPTDEGPADDYVAQRTYAIPARGPWVVSNGGRSKETNRHVGNRHQWYALDLSRRGPNNEEVKNDGSRNEDDFSWNESVLAPADGVVVSVVNGVPDHEPSHTDRYYVPGNTVVIDHGGGEFSILAHFRLNSILVRPGQRVRQGAPLGKVGNSGNSSGPHIHWHLANDGDVSRGHGLPIRFAPLEVNGQRVESPVVTRGDVIDNGAGN